MDRLDPDKVDRSRRAEHFSRWAIPVWSGWACQACWRRGVRDAARADGRSGDDR